MVSSSAKPSIVPGPMHAGQDKTVDKAHRTPSVVSITCCFKPNTRIRILII